MQLDFVSQIEDYGPTNHFDLSFGNFGNNYHIVGMNLRVQISFFYDIYFYTSTTLSVVLWDLLAKIVMRKRVLVL